MTRLEARASPAVTRSEPSRRALMPAPAAPPRHAGTGRDGVTFVEMLVVLALLTIAAGLTGPKTLALLLSAKATSARTQLAAVAEAARASALQRQRPATLSVVNGAGGATITASIDTGGLRPYVVSRLTVGTTVTPRLPADTAVTYDARGMLAPRRWSALIYLIGPGAGDSVCLSRYGHLLPRTCAP